LEGFRGDPEAAGTPDVRSNWAIGDDPNAIVQCLPWIVVRTNSGADLHALDGRNLGLRFRTQDAKRTVVHSPSDTDRRIVELDPSADAARFAPGPDRLRDY